MYTLQPWHHLERTPGGWRVLDAAGHVLLDFPRASFQSALATPPLAGWVALASWTKTGRGVPRSFRCSWVVPRAPRTDSGQTLFLFSAIATPGLEHIVQPVLQWQSAQAEGPAGWSVSSWYAEPDGIAIHTAPVAVQPGERLTALIRVQGTATGQNTFTVELAGKPGTRLIVPELPELTWYAMALEAHGVTRRTDYPDVPETRFAAALQFAGPEPRVTWLPATHSRAFGETMTISENSGTTAQTAVNYGKPGPAPVAASTAVPAKAKAAPKPVAPPRSWWKRILGSWVVFLLALIALFVTATEIEWNDTQHDFRTYAGLLFAEVALPAILAGIVAKGRLFGVLIDDRNRISLGRFQMLCWAVLILGSYFLMAIWNVHHAGGHMPGVPEDLWFLLGITNGSSVASAALLAPKRRLTQAAASGEAVTPDSPAAQQSLLHVRDNPADASWTDLFQGEEVSNKDTVDVSRLQQFAFTIILLFVFAGKVLDQLASVTGGALNMPDLDPSALGLLGISNAAYLASKQTPKPPVTAT